MKSGNVETIGKYTPPGFQSVPQDGARSRGQASFSSISCTRMLWAVGYTGGPN